MKTYYFEIGTINGTSNVKVEADSFDEALEKAKRWYTNKGFSLKDKFIWAGTSPFHLTLCKKLSRNEISANEFDYLFEKHLQSDAEEPTQEMIQSELTAMERKENNNDD